jgi:hypothetical protein
MHKGTKGGLRQSPDLMMSETRVFAWYLIVEMNRATESEQPEVTFLVLWPSQSGIYHHGTSGLNRILDGVLGNPVVMMPSHAAVLDALTFGGELRGKLL